MTNEFDMILDKCIDRLSRGESLENCLADYPEHKAQLEPLLKAMTETAKAYSFVPSTEAKRSARLKLYAEFDRRRQPSFWQRMVQPRLAWISAAAVVLLVAVSLVVLRPVLWPAIPTTTIPSASVNGNFIFMVSDDINAIEDFSTVDVTIEKVWLLHTGEQEEWIEFTPSTQEFNLALLPGDTTQVLWQGNVPLGEYTRVVIEVGQVTGVLEATSETIEIKLPSDKLQLKIPFNVSADSVTSFTFDLTVVNTGNAQDGAKYLLKTQASESGSTQTPLTSEQTTPDKEKDQKEPRKQP